jgi:hypothetical protein
MKTIHHNHFCLTKSTYQERLSIGFYRASFPEGFKIEEVKPLTLDLLLSKIARVDKSLHWDKQPKLRDKEAFIRDYLQTPDSKLFALMDGDREIGFSMIKTVSSDNQARFFSSGDKGVLSRLFNRLFAPKVIEIDYLALYDGEEGQGRGRLYFEMFFAALFKKYNTIYWSQFTSNAPTLERFYREKMGMTLLAKDEVPDFRVL